jgi:phage gpG-like protein
MKVSIEVEGQEKLDVALKGAAADLANFRIVARPVSDEIYSIERAQFQTQGQRAGSRWPARSQAYLASLTRLNRSGFRSVAEPLRRTDALFQAVTTRGAPGGVYEESEDSLTLGTSIPYARYHQEGTLRMPQRKIYDLTERDVQGIGRVIKRAYKRPLADRGFDYRGDSGEIPF